MVKNLLKIILIFIIFINVSYANKTIFVSKLSKKVSNKLILKNENDKISYALGASLGNYLNSSLKKQRQLGIFLNNSKFILGFQNSIMDKSKLSLEEISKLLKILEKRVKFASEKNYREQSKKNFIIGKKFLDNILKNKDVKKTSSGLVYVIQNKGDTKQTVFDNSIYTVNYVGKLINGKEFDSSYIRGKPFSFTLDSVIPGWKEGLKFIGKGGKIKLIVPPHLAYDKIVIPGIPINSILIFDIEILDIKN